MIKEFCDICEVEMTDKQQISIITSQINPFEDLKDGMICPKCYNKIGGFVKRLKMP